MFRNTTQGGRGFGINIICFLISSVSIQSATTTDPTGVTWLVYYLIIIFGYKLGIDY